MNARHRNLQAALARFCALVVFLSLVVGPGHKIISAQPQPLKMSQRDIVIELDPEWISVRVGGYYPLRMKIQNRGPDCELRVVTTDRDQHSGSHRSPTVEKRISLTQNATANLTLLIPIVSQDAFGHLQVYKDGRRLDQISYIYQGEYLTNDRSKSLLSIAVSRPNFNSYSAFALGQARSSTYGTSFESDFENILPASAPDTWMAYTGVDVITIDALSFESRLSATQRDELLRWVRTGGNLLIYDVNRLPGGNKDLDKAIKWDSIAATTDQWSSTAAVLNIPTVPMRGSSIFNQGVKGELQFRSMMFGQVVAIQKNPFNQSSEYWSRIFNALGRQSHSWVRRHGFSPRIESPDFLEFVIGGIRVIPTWGFIVLITLFSILIGPVNYYVLSRKNKIGQLLWTTPVIALLTSLALFGYSSIANGTSSRVRLRSVTMLDQKSQTAVSMTRAAMFSGVTPRNGLRFEPFSAVYPIWQERDAFEVGHVDWTDAQVLTGSFHPGNTRSQFLITTPRTERGRIQIGEVAQNRLPITNGLEWGIKNILVRTKDGEYFAGADLEAGQKLALEPAAASSIEEFKQLIAAQQVTAPILGPRPMNSSMPHHYMSVRSSADFSSSLLESYMNWFARDLDRPEMGLENESYVAVLSEPPKLDIGLNTYKTFEELHVLYGFY